jgi:hypothetical protein
VGRVVSLFDGWNYYISLAELEYKRGEIKCALSTALIGKNYAKTKAQKTAIGIFIAKCYGQLGDYQKSSAIYRELIDEKVYLPPVMLGIMYNNLKVNNDEKAERNISLIKIFEEKDE